MSSPRADFRRQTVPIRREPRPRFLGCGSCHERDDLSVAILSVLLGAPLALMFACAIAVGILLLALAAAFQVYRPTAPAPRVDGAPPVVPSALGPWNEVW